MIIRHPRAGTTMSATDETTTAEGPTGESLRELPPSAKLVLKVLEYNDELTQRQLADETRLSARTVRHALGRLDEADAVEERTSFTDARKRLYSLHSASL
jgi:DNA-binding MarR family transcriptional regulator